MWPINGLEAIQSEIKNITKIKNKTTLPPPFFDGSGRETNNFFIWLYLYIGIMHGSSLTAKIDESETNLLNMQAIQSTFPRNSCKLR